MKQHSFEIRYQQFWNDFEQQLTRLEKKHKKHPEHLQQTISFPQNYQNLCQQLALAEARGYSPLLVSHLQQLVQRGHHILYKHRTHLGQKIIHFILFDFPQSIRQEKNLVISASLIFYGISLITALITLYFPDFIYFFMSPDELEQFEHMYDPAAESVGRSADIDWFMFAYYIKNNIGIAFQMFAGGIIFGLGTLIYLIYNAFYMGAIAAHISSYGYGQTFWTFVIGHSAFELTAIIIAAAAGLKIGLALLMPKRKTRLEALRSAAKSSIQLVLGAFLMLIIAAFIESYWSSMNNANNLKVIVGALLWLAVLSYFMFAGRRGAHYAHR